jgi:hypothetical protein
MHSDDGSRWTYDGESEEPKAASRAYVEIAVLATGIVVFAIWFLSELLKQGA